MSRRRGLIIGASGQDGAYLSKLLLDKGYDVYAGCRKHSPEDLWRLAELGISERVHLLHVDLASASSLSAALEDSRPDEIYNLGGQTFIASVFEEALEFTEVVALAVARLLKLIEALAPGSRFCQASSSEIFGNTDESPQTEKSVCRPRSPYGVAKLYSQHLVRVYREQRGLFACNAILYNHESPLRGRQFVTQKVVCGLAQAYLGEQAPLSLGNLDARRDWGYAGDYTDALWRMLQAPQPDDYIVSTGETRSVRQMVEMVAGLFGFNLTWQGSGGKELGIDQASGRVLIEASASDGRPVEEVQLVGNPEKARQKLGWSPGCEFPEVLARMARAELRRLNAALDLPAGAQR